MAYISPNSDIYILRRVPLDSSYNHTGYFTNATAQYDKFYSYLKYTFNVQSYQRVNKNKIRLSITADALYDCNYLMFRNTAFGSKWFYAFLDSIEYVNNQCSEITYSIDVMQTWYFDYGMGDCFVEREHSDDDTIGSNTVPENFELGEMVENLSQSYVSTRYLACIATTKRLSNSQTSYINTGDEISFDFDKTLWYHLEAQGDTNTAISGVPNGCYMYMGIPVSKDDIPFWTTNEAYYNIQDYRVYNTDRTVNASMTSVYPLTLPALLNAISTIDRLSYDDIVAIYIYPADLSNKNYMNNAATLGYSYGTAINENAIQVGRPTRFVDPRNGSYYTPRNNKLFTFPYVDLKVNNNQGVERIYQFERFDTTVGNWFAWVGIQSNSTMVFYPRGYNYAGSSINEGVALDTYFPVPIKSNAYDSWSQSQKTGALFGFLGNVLHTGTGIALGAATGNVAGVAMGGASLIGNVASAVGNLMDIHNAPDQISGNVINGNLNVATRRLGFRAVSRTIKPEYARIIDDYFTMFGYATRRVKTPNVRTAHRRQNWNYIKTVGAIVKPLPTSGLPADDIKKIMDIYDHGVTFWSDISNIGDYTLSNPIL